MKKTTFHKIAHSVEEIDFGVNNLAQLNTGSKKICIAKFGDNLFACTAQCPHASGILADGFLDGLGNIVCPLHRYKYDLRNGRNVSGEGYFLKTYPVEVRDDGVYVGIETFSLF